MHIQQQLDHLIGSIYETAVNPDRWPTVLTAVAAHVGARGAFLFELLEEDGGRRIRAPYFSDRYDRALVDGYLARHMAQELADQDEFARCSRQSDGIDLIDDSVLAPSEAALLARANVAEMLRYGIRYRMGGLLNKDHVTRDRFALQFAPDTDPSTPEVRERIARVLPHIAKALDVARPMAVLAARQTAILHSLDRLRVGICIVNAHGEIVLANTEFERQIETYGVYRRSPRGKLVVVPEASARRAADLTEALSGHGRFGARPRKEAILCSLEGREHALCLEITPLRMAEDLGEPKLKGHIVYSLDTSQAFAIDTALMARQFALTAAESGVFQMMAEGLTNNEISDRRSTSVETVNTQVKSILSKTQTANRVQAIRLATNISFSLVADEVDMAGVAATGREAAAEKRGSAAT